MRRSRYLFGALVLLLTVAHTAAQQGGPERVHLELRILDERGNPLGGAVVTVLGGGSEQHLEGDRKGHLGLDLTPASYVLVVSRPGYHDLELRGVEIRIPENPERRKTKLRPLRVMLQPRAPVAGTGREAEGEVSAPLRPRVVEPPSLAIRFEPQGLRKGLQARGVLTLTNQGGTALRLPLNPDSLEAPWTPETLLLKTHISMEGSEVGFDAAFACEPQAGTCQELAPGESAQVLLELRHLPSDGVGLDVQAPWDRSGALDGKVSAYLIYPEQPGESREVRTRTVEAHFHVTIKEPRR